MTQGFDMAEQPALHVRDLVLADEADTVRLAEEIAAHAMPGDLVLLSGALGAGKTALSRALIRVLAEDSALEVPSPTFTLVQRYDTPRLPAHHVDLYRISGPGEVDELGLDEALAEGLVLVEWPERAAGLFAGDRLDIALALEPSAPAARSARMVGHGRWAARLARIEESSRFLAASGYGAWHRRHLEGDASRRRYERLHRDGETVVLMDSPRAPDPGTGTGAMPYSRIAHLAEDVVPFVAVARTLRSHGLSAPDILAADLDGGFLVIEDLGDGRVTDELGQPIVERYEAAIDLLVRLHGLDLPAAAEAAPGRVHHLPAYDEGAFMAEVELLVEWFVPHALGARLSPGAETAFRHVWLALLTESAALSPALSGAAWVLRDFHSPNLVWLPERSGIPRVGLLDFQDSVIGSAAYDVASLAFDARVDVPGPLRAALIERYLAGRRAADADFDGETFHATLALMAAQRNTKILGIFARLANRDAKPRYLAHIPRIADYLGEALAHPALARLANWHAENLPLETCRRAHAPMIAP